MTLLLSTISECLQQIYATDPQISTPKSPRRDLYFLFIYYFALLLTTFFLTIPL